MVWTINYTESAKRQLHKFDKQIARRIIHFMDERISRQEDPRHSGTALAGPAFGMYWRYRIGDYRIICDIQDEVLCILVIEIGNRREIYR
ncbi:MAG TPA: type II toxin-antitoxin system RelE/ParE family toxin [Burkholderiales bacterium]|nr:type II toxin-antitoxin system RelE/ParE family toxin [Burkholderiales bacterium]